jgi:transposase InsO family protein
LKPAQKVELAHQLIAPNGPYSKSQVVRALKFARGSLYLQSKRAFNDKQIVIAIEQWHELDDTLGHHRLAVLLGVSKNRVYRIMHKYGITARRKKKRSMYSGESDLKIPDLTRELEQNNSTGIIFSDIFEVLLFDQTQVRCCFALWKHTWHILAMAFDDRMQTDYLETTIRMVPFEVPGEIFHFDRSKQYKAARLIPFLLERGFRHSMSQANKPTDDEHVQRIVKLFLLLAVKRQPYRSLGDFLRIAQYWVNFYNITRPPEALDYYSSVQE